MLRDLRRLLTVAPSRPGTLFSLFIIVLVGLAALSSMENGPFSSRTTATGEQAVTSERVEAIVRDFLMREPDVVYEALRQWNSQREVEIAERQRAAVAEHQHELYHDPADPIGGNPEGDVTLVEFFDYQCDFCRKAVESVESVMGADDGLRVVFKELPILGEDSDRAARAALASREQDAYQRLHFALMRAEDLSEAGIVRLAEANGLNAERLLADMQAPEIDETLARNRALAHALGITETPAFVVGAQLTSGAVDQVQLQKMFEGARAGSSDHREPARLGRRRDRKHDPLDDGRSWPIE